MALKYNKAPFLCYFKLCASFDQFKVELQSGNTKSGQNQWFFFVLFDLAIWQMPLKNNRVHLVWYFNLCASFHSHRSIQAGVTIQKCQIRVQIVYFLSRVTLKFHGWPWKTIGIFLMPNQALCIISSPYMNSNWSYSPETAKLGFDLCDFDLWPWPWPFVWTSLQSMVITPENFMMIQWWEHNEKGVMDRQTDGHLLLWTNPQHDASLDG